MPKADLNQRPPQYQQGVRTTTQDNHARNAAIFHGKYGCLGEYGPKECL